MEIFREVQLHVPRDREHEINKSLRLKYYVFYNIREVTISIREVSIGHVYVLARRRHT